MTRTICCGQYSIWPENAPQTFSMNAIESLLKLHVVDIQLPLPFGALFNDVAQSEDLVCTSSSLPKTCLLLSELQIHCFRDPPDDELSKDLGWIDRRVIPLQVLQSLRAPFFRIFTMTP